MQSAYRGCRTAAAGHPHDVPGYTPRPTPRRRRRDDNEQVSEDTRAAVRARLDQALAYVRSAEPRVPLSRRAIVTDIVIAALALAASLVLLRSGDHSGTLTVTSGPGAGQVVVQSAWQSLGQLWRHAAAAVLLTSVPLAFRRRFPLAAFAVLLAGALATRPYATDVTFLAIVFAGYSAVAYSRFRNAAMLSMPLAGLLVACAFWNATPAVGLGSGSVTHIAARPPGEPPLPLPPAVAGVSVEPSEPWRLAGFVVATALVLIAVVGNAVQSRDRLRRLQAEHEAATRRALEAERARIAGELHDVVTHNVSVMIVQAGAARQVLTESPGEAREALLAVESSGRAAMTELRHLLGLLSPPEAGAEGASPGEEDLRPQPGLGQLQPLIDRISAAGLPVELHVAGVPRALPPGQDLTAFRVVQEALTNVIKHAGKPRTAVTLDYRADDLVVEVADAGRPFPAAGPTVTAPGGGRGLLGLRERTALYRGELEAGPRPGGGWLVRARIPVDPVSPAGAAAEPAVPGRAPESTSLTSPAAGPT
jgi:signal transduction histidine kinase